MIGKGFFFVSNELKKEKVMPAFSGVMPVMRALLVSFLFSLVLFVILSFVMLSTNLSENMICPAVLIVSLIAMLIGGIIAARRSEMRGFLIGGITGLCYMLILYIVGVLGFSAPAFTMNGLIRFLYAFVAGAVGGVIGRNLADRKRR